MPAQSTAEQDDSPVSEPLRRLFEEDYDFVMGDVYRQEATYLTIDLVFCEPGPGVLSHSRRLQRLNPAWQLYPDGKHRIHWQAVGAFKNGIFVTEHYLIDPQGAIIQADTPALLEQLIAMNPLLRLRDSRTLPDASEEPEEQDKAQQELLGFSRRLSELEVQEDGGFTGAEVKAGLQVLNEIAGKYLSVYKGHKSVFRRNTAGRPRSIREMVSRPFSLESLDSLRCTLQDSSLNKEKIMAVMLASALSASRGSRKVDPKARPLLVLEDIESRLHPSLLLSFWSVAETVPVQKIVTTNSGDLLSAVPLFSLRRLCRQYYDTRCYAVTEDSFTADDLRRIAFHIRINRPMTLYARTWVLVEGETEIWMLSEMAALLGISLPCKGIRLVEFAQCGLPPLLKLASALGISFYVLTDGDDAGKRYAQTVAGYVGRRHVSEHLTVLPSLDTEHFFYTHGYAEVFLEAAGLKGHDRRSLHQDRDKVIDTAIHKKSKPGMALAVMARMQERGRDGVPELFCSMLRQILRLSESEIGLD